MTKLQRTVDGYSLQIVNLPKIFSRLAQDLPSGVIALPDGEKAYYRISRVQSDAKRAYKSPREIAPLLAEALQSLVQSTPFMNQYGLREAPSLGGNLQDLVITLRNLLTQNQHTVTYSSTTRSLGPGRGHTLIEEINVPLSNLVHLYAVRGGPIRAKGEACISGTIHISAPGADGVVGEGFKFKIVSPNLDLSKYIGPDRIADEVVAKMKKNLALFVGSATITYDDSQFDGFVTQGLAALENKKTNKPKKAAIEVAKPLAKPEPVAIAFDLSWNSVLTEEQYRSLSVIERREYLEIKANFAKTDLSLDVDKEVASRFLQSGILAIEYRQHTTNSNTAPLTHEYFIARKIGLTDEQVQSVLGTELPKFIAGLDSSVSVGDKSGDLGDLSQSEVGEGVEDFAQQLLNSTIIAGAEGCEGGACELPNVGRGNLKADGIEEAAAEQVATATRAAQHHGDFADWDEAKDKLIDASIGDEVKIGGSSFELAHEGWVEHAEIETGVVVEEDSSVPPDSNELHVLQQRLNAVAANADRGINLDGIDSVELLVKIRAITRPDSDHVDSISIKGINALEAAIFGMQRGRYLGSFKYLDELAHGKEFDFAFLNGVPVKLDGDIWRTMNVSTNED